LDASNPHYKTRRVIPSWNCQPFGHGGLLNKDPIVRLTAQVWTLDLGFSDETYLLLLFAYNLHWEKPSNSNQLLASRTFEVTHSFHHDQQSQFKTDSRKFGPDRELPYIYIMTLLYNYLQCSYLFDVNQHGWLDNSHFKRE
jgi:hypothetical protein